MWAVLFFGWAFLVLICIALAVLSIIGWVLIFQKAGKHGWAAIIPFYNFYVVCDIVYGNGWLFLLTFLPLGGILFECITYYRLAKAFGKGGGFGIGLVLFSFIFLLVLAFGGAQYQGPDGGGMKGVLIASIIFGVLGVVFFSAAMAGFAFGFIDGLEDSGALELAAHFLPQISA